VWVIFFFNTAENKPPSTGEPPFSFFLEQAETEIFHVSLSSLLFRLHHDAN
jgi:hypothetical protein